MSVESQIETIKLASIVSIDVVGFSTMSERDQRRTARQIEALRTRVEAVALANGGRIFNTAGDGFMLEFGSAGAALGAIQDLLDKRPKGEPSIRVGAHVGDVIVAANNDLLGHGVNVAARLQSLAEPSGALVSGEFRSMARTSPTAAFRARGRQPLENIDQRVHTFEILSRRARIMRVLQRIGLGFLALVAIVGAALATPHMLNFARTHNFPSKQAPQALATPHVEIAAPLAQAAPAAPIAVVAPTAPAAPLLPAQPGQTLRDCETCPELIVLPGGGFRMGSVGSPGTELEFAL